MNARYKFSSCAPGLCPRGYSWDQLAQVEQNSDVGAVTLKQLASNALLGAIIGAPAGAVVAGRGQRPRGAMQGAAVGAGASIAVGLLLRALFPL